MEPKIEVLKVNLGRKGKVLAYFSARVTFGGYGITLPDLKVLNGTKGKFIAAPTRKTQDGRFIALFYPNKAFMDALRTAGLKAYDKALLDEKWTVRKPVQAGK